MSQCTIDRLFHCWKFNFVGRDPAQNVTVVNCIVLMLCFFHGTFFIALHNTDLLETSHNCIALLGVHCTELYFILLLAYTGEQIWTSMPFEMWDENTTVPKEAGHSHLDWPSGGTCHCQALSELSTKVAVLLAETNYTSQPTSYSVRCTLSSV